MVRDFQTCVVAWFATLLFGSLLFAQDVEAKPNVVVIVTDDLGYGDTNLFGVHPLHDTPAIEALASEGMLFSSAVATPLCSPTRYALTTGMHPARGGWLAASGHETCVRFRDILDPNTPPWAPLILPLSATRIRPSEITIAELLKARGYSTGHFGKWHLGRTPHMAADNGFDVEFPQTPAAGPPGGYYGWATPAYTDDPSTTEDDNVEDATALQAVEFIRENRNKPFFLNYWQFSVHAPYEADPVLAAQYKVRADRIVAEGGPRYSHTYAAMVRKADRNIGRVITALKNAGVWENTIVVWMSDNGGSTHTTVDGVAPADNGPFRGGKGTILEGGVRVPLIVRWPGNTRAGSTSDTLISCIDVYPTIAQMTKTRLDHVVDGQSFVPTLRGNHQQTVVYNYLPYQLSNSEALPPSASITVGNLKLYKIFYDGPNQSHRYLMFDVWGDPQEQHDLAAIFPDYAAKLVYPLNVWLQETGAVLPKPNPEYTGL
jgi:arylsulfatase A-like enzyme